ncbi:hypothetical protein JTB14_002737 [Gonioctena quinquepunctata]|nr:hypothetical protein JTB14_002737 [Gonioctena quinquepunctata]
MAVDKGEGNTFSGKHIENTDITGKSYYMGSLNQYYQSIAKFPALEESSEDEDESNDIPRCSNYRPENGKHEISRKLSKNDQQSDDEPLSQLISESKKGKNDRNQSIKQVQI